MIAKPANVAAVYDDVGKFVYTLGVIQGYNPVPSITCKTDLDLGPPPRGRPETSSLAWCPRAGLPPERILTMIPTLFLVSVICFVVIRVQPGCFAVATWRTRASRPRPWRASTPSSVWTEPGRAVPLVGRRHRRRARARLLGLANRPVSGIVGERLVSTAWSRRHARFRLVVAIRSVSVALRRNGLTDAIASFIGYIGLAVPDFLVALLLVALVLAYGGTNLGGLFSSRFLGEPWSWAKLVDLLNHLWIPVLAIGQRHRHRHAQMRANLLDVLHADYVRTAKAKGLAPGASLPPRGARRHQPARVARRLPVPELVDGTIIASIVLNLPTIGPLLYTSLLNKDQYVAMTLLLSPACCSCWATCSPTWCWPGSTRGSAMADHVRAAARHGPRRKAWRRFMASRAGVAGAWILLVLYTVALLAPFLAPYGITVQHRNAVHQPPHTSASGRRAPARAVRPPARDRPRSGHLPPFLRRGHGRARPREALRARRPYRMFGLWTSDVHLFGASEGNWFPLGTAASAATSCRARWWARRCRSPSASSAS